MYEDYDMGGEDSYLDASWEDRFELNFQDPFDIDPFWEYEEDEPEWED